MELCNLNYDKLSEGSKAQYNAEFYCEVLDGLTRQDRDTISEGARGLIEIYKNEGLVISAENTKKLVDECIAFFFDDAKEEAGLHDKNVIDKFYENGRFSAGNYFVICENDEDDLYPDSYYAAIDYIDKDDIDEDEKIEEVCRKKTEYSFSKIEKEYMSKEIEEFIKKEGLML